MKAYAEENRKGTIEKCHIKSDYTSATSLLEDKFQTICAVGNHLQLEF